MLQLVQVSGSPPGQGGEHIVICGVPDYHRLGEGVLLEELGLGEAQVPDIDVAGSRPGWGAVNPGQIPVQRFQQFNLRCLRQDLIPEDLVN